MTQPVNLGNICGSSIPGVRKIILPDGDQVGIVGLDEVMEALYKEKREPDDSTAAEMICRLREKNYIADTRFVEELYRKALLKEYGNFLARKKR